MTEGSGSGSRRPRNTQIQQIWIRIPNTAGNGAIVQKSYIKISNSGARTAKLKINYRGAIIIVAPGRKI
jgi:hypothetical protein